MQKTLRCATALVSMSQCAVAVVLMTSTSVSLAEEPRKATEPSVLAEPTELTQIVDAFDDNDPFDAHISLGFEHTAKSARILRETNITQPDFTSGGYTADNLNVAQYDESVSRLLTRADFGLYHDIALIVRLPIILADSRELSGLDGSEQRQSLVLKGAPGEQLFSLPFQSPTRSGLEYLAVGLDFGIFNQYRNPTKPTWVFGFEGRFNVSEPMHACNAKPAAGQVECADLSDFNRDGKAGAIADDGTELEGTFSGGRSAGVSRGTNAFELHSFVSRRIKYIEPYAGFRTLFEFQSSDSDFTRSDLKGSLVNHPPLRGTMIMGLSVMPWEIREKFQRVTLDFRFEGTYVSEGKDYSELFDAVGSSSARSLRSPQFAEYKANDDPDTSGQYPSVIDPSSQRVYFSGITDVQQYGIYTLKTNFTWQAGQFVKFNVGGSYSLVQSHFITADQACNPDFSNDGNRAGPCRADGGISGIPNPNYRRALNDPGRRFRVDGANALSGWVNATVMF